MLISLCRNRITITRQTSEIFSKQVCTASITVTNGSPTIDANVQITIFRPNPTDTKTGTVTVTGVRTLTNGSALSVTEDLEFTGGVSSLGSTIGLTANTFTSVTSISVTGSIISSSVQILGEYMGRDGGNVAVQTTLVSGFPAQITRKNESWPDQLDGTTANEKPYMLLPVTESVTPRQGDVVKNEVTSEEYLVVGTPLIESYIGNQFYKVMLNKRDNSVVS